MKVRFLEMWPKVRHTEASFDICCIGVGGPYTPLIARLTIPPLDLEASKERVQIYAQQLGAKEGTLICWTEFESCDDASRAMTFEGIDVIDDKSVQAHVMRFVAARKAEFVDKI